MSQFCLDEHDVEKLRSEGLIAALGPQSPVTWDRKTFVTALPQLLRAVDLCLELLIAKGPARKQDA